jgi:glycosyltransferase involved in cell wall biosynthesis
MLRQDRSPLRFAHSSGGLPLNQAMRREMREAFSGVERKPVVLQVMPTIDAPGAEAAALWAAEAAAMAGGRSIVAAGGGPVERLRRIGVEGHTLRLDSRGPLSIARNAGRLRRLIEELGVDIVHARSREIAWVARQATLGGRVRLVTSCGADAPFRDSGKDGGALTEGDCIIAGSGHVRDVIVARDPAKSDRIAVIPDGADFGICSPDVISAERLTRLSQSWGMLDEPSPTILAPGDLVPLRGQHVLARALGAISTVPQLQHTVVIIAGEVGQKNSYAAQLGWIARKDGASGRVFLTETMDDMPAAMMLSDVVASLPMEPLGQDPTAAMAMALGKPVIGADHGATAEVVLDGATGRLASPTDPEAVAAAIQDIMMRPPDKRAEMAELARQRAATLFSSTASALATARTYAALFTSMQR